ncbi:MAG: Uma2 family endonuclease [Acidobacteriota bacterium]|nr:Uma2 family endonuclease [Acidobacteriota bacterium]
MATILQPPETKPEMREVAATGILLHNISWATYESLLKDHEGVPYPHFTYDRGELLIMTLSPEHETFNRNIALLVEVLAEEMEVESRGFGSTTYKREDLQRGFEPDSCFYFKNEMRMRGKKRLDLTTDPPPDLIVEVDITHPSINRLPIFAAFGVPEVWRFEGEELEILRLAEGVYIKSETSVVLPLVDGETLAGFIKKSVSMMGRLEWLREVRAWARERKGSEETQ